MKHQNPNRHPQRLAAAGVLLMSLLASGGVATPRNTTGDGADRGVGYEGSTYASPNPGAQAGSGAGATIAIAKEDVVKQKGPSS